MCRGCLPTRVRLQNKGVHCPTQCVSCASGHDDLAHLLFDCPFATQVWHMTDLWSHITVYSSTTSVVEAIFWLVDTLCGEQKQLFVVVLWSLWKHRNLKVWEDVTEGCVTVVEQAGVMVTEWKLANIPGG